MPAAKPIFSKATFEFFRNLGKHNKKEWMDVNRERYQETIVRPFRRMLRRKCPRLYSNLTTGLTPPGEPAQIFPRINRDIRFAKDKTI